jgi:hypothetical protein
MSAKGFCSTPGAFGPNHPQSGRRSGLGLGRDEAAYLGQRVSEETDQRCDEEDVGQSHED